MNEATIAERARAVYDELCKQLGEFNVLLWHFSPAGELLAEPFAPPFPTAVIQDAARKLCAQKSPEPLEIAPGQWLFPLEDKLGTRRGAMNLALASVSDPEQVRRMGIVLRWGRDEIVRAERDGRTIEQFSEKLAQAYEETNLLYRMARLLNTTSDAAKSIEAIGMQLQQVLPFEWLAIIFSRQAHGVPELADRMILAGKPRFEAELIRTLSEPLLGGSSNDTWTKLLNPKSDPLAAATGAEVLAEPITHDHKVIGLLLAGNKYGPDPELSSFEIQFLDATADFLGVFHENLARFAEQQELFLGTIRAMTASIDAKDRYTCGHSERVGLMASKMAQLLGLDKRLIEQYRIAGLVHDVGKIGVPESVLCKPGRLTTEEFDQIKLHPAIGHNILKDIPALQPVLPGVLSHHERWDGKGYPNRAAGEEIPLIARVLALADTFDAMSSNRSYRPALPRTKVLEEIIKCSGTQFDPNLVPMFVSMDFSEFDTALEQHKAREQFQPHAA